MLPHIKNATKGKQNQSNILPGTVLRYY